MVQFRFSEQCLSRGANAKWVPLSFSSTPPSTTKNVFFQEKALDRSSVLTDHLDWWPGNLMSFRNPSIPSKQMLQLLLVCINKYFICIWSVRRILYLHPAAGQAGRRSISRSVLPNTRSEIRSYSNNASCNPPACCWLPTDSDTLTESAHVWHHISSRTSW